MDDADRTSDRTTVAISGGGPAGVMLGLLLARRGVDTVVLEKHEDFLRDFRGDTVHPSTQLILQQLGLLDEFQRIVRGRMRAIDFGTPDGPLVHREIADVNRRHPFHEIALAPQWDLLDLLVRHARRSPHFRIDLQAETVGVLRRGGAVRGLRYRRDGAEHALEAVLTIDANGRGSVLRGQIGAPLHEYGAPIDVLWFRIAHHDDDPAELRGTIGRGGGVVAVNRGDYWQVALLVPKGTFPEIRAAGLPAFRERVARIATWTADRMTGVDDWDDVKLLSVTVERLARWWTPGLLAIGDAAHTMSPIGGIGINLAIADAVATANLLGDRLLEAQADPRRYERVLNPRLLERVQRRREWPTAVTQRIQVAAQDRIVAIMRSGADDLDRPLVPPRAARVLLDSPLNRVLPRVFVYGLRPETVAT